MTKYFRSPALNLLPAAMLTLLGACGGGSTGSDADQQAGSFSVPEILTISTIAAAEGGLENIPIQITGLTKVSEVRISRTTYEYTFNIQIQNSNTTVYEDVSLKLIGAGSGTTIVDGEANTGTVAGKSLLQLSDTISVRHDRSLPFEPKSLKWTVAATPLALPAYRGRFIDRQVEGLKWKSSLRDGITDSEGYYLYDFPGEIIRFYLGDLYLGSATAAINTHVTDIIATPEQLASGRNIKVAQLIQSFDDRRLPDNSIKISSNLYLAPNSIDFTANQSAFDASLKSLLGANARSGNFVEYDAAKWEAGRSIELARDGCPVPLAPPPVGLSESNHDQLTCDDIKKINYYNRRIAPLLRAEQTAALEQAELAHGTFSPEKAAEAIDNNFLLAGFETFDSALDIFDPEKRKDLFSKGIRAANAVTKYSATLVKTLLAFNSNPINVSDRDAKVLEITSKAFEIIGSASECAEIDVPKLDQCLTTVTKTIQALGDEYPEYFSKIASIDSATAKETLKTAISSLNVVGALGGSVIKLSTGKENLRKASLNVGAAVVRMATDAAKLKIAQKQYQGATKFDEVLVVILEDVAGPAMEVAKECIGIESKADLYKCRSKVAQEVSKALIRRSFAGADQIFTLRYLTKHAALLVAESLIKEVLWAGAGGTAELFKRFEVPSQVEGQNYRNYLRLEKLAKNIGEKNNNMYGIASHQGFVNLIWQANFNDRNSYYVDDALDTFRNYNGIINRDYLNTSQAPTVTMNASVDPFGEVNSVIEINTESADFRNGSVLCHSASSLNISLPEVWSDQFRGNSRLGFKVRYRSPGIKTIICAIFELNGRYSESRAFEVQVNKVSLAELSISANPAEIFSTVEFWISRAFEEVRMAIWSIGKKIISYTAAVFNGLSAKVSVVFDSPGISAVDIALKDDKGTTLGFISTSIGVYGATSILATAEITSVKTDAGVEIPDNTATTEKRPRLSGTVTTLPLNFYVVRLYLDGTTTLLGNATVSGTTWTFDLLTDLAAGAHSLIALVERADGVQGVASTARRLTITAEVGAGDLSADFSVSQNPNGQWSYGWSQMLGGNFRAFNLSTQIDGLPNFKVWTAATPYSLFVGKNTSNVQIYWPFANIPSQTVVFHPGQNSEKSIARWTAVSAGQVEIAVTFRLAESGTVDVHVQKNGSDIFTDALTYGTRPSVSATKVISLQVGDTLDFVVGEGGNGYLADTTLLTAAVNTANSASIKLNPANNRHYQVIDCGTWTSCRDAAINRGGQLVTIRSQAENDWLAANFSMTALYWIGAYYDIPTRTWKWASGEPLLYTNWGNNLNNSGGDEYCSHFFPPTPGYWNDVRCGYEYSTKAIVEYPVAIPKINDASLVGWWTFDDCAATDSSGHGNHGILVSTIGCEAGRSGKALRFSGGTVNISDSSSLRLEGQVTLSVLVRLDSDNNSAAGILQKGQTNVNWDYGMVVYSHAPAYRSTNTDWLPNFGIGVSSRLQVIFAKNLIEHTERLA